MSHNTALHLHGPSPSGAMFRRRTQGPPKERQGEEESNTLCACRCEKHFSNTPCALFQVGPGAQGWETEQEFLSLSALESCCRKADTPKGENKGSCQDTSMWCTRRRQPSLHHFLMAEKNQNAAHRVLLPHSSWGFNAFCPVIKKLHRLELNMENMIHPVSRASVPPFIKPETCGLLSATALLLQRLRQSESRRCLWGAVCLAPSPPYWFPFFLNTDDRILYMLRWHGGKV